MKKNDHIDVMEVEAEEMLPDTPLEKVIETALVKANITEQVIQKLQETYGEMKLASIDDKSSYLEIKDARRDVRKVGILTEKITKKGREDAIRVQRLWLDKEREILGKIAKIQDPLDAEIKKFEDEVERKETEEKIKREETFMARQAALFKYGAEYKSGSYELEEISYETELIKQADNEMWDEVILPKYRKVYDRKEAALVAEEAKRKEEADRQKKELKELEEKQAAFKKEQEEFEKQKLEMQRQKEESEKVIREAQQKKQQEELKKKFELRNNRVSELRTLGCNYDMADEAYFFDGIMVISGAEVETLSEKEWADLVLKTKPVIEKAKSEAEAKRLAEIEVKMKADMELAAKKERERIAQEEILKEKQRKELEDEKQRQIEAAKDKVKYEVVVDYLLKCPVFEFKSSIYKHKSNIINDFLDGLKH